MVKPHPVTGIPNGKFAIWLFLASEVLLFGALFSSYVLIRTQAPHWPPEGGLSSEILNVPLATLNTAVLITSSITMVLAWASCKMGRIDRFRLWMGGTVALAFVFLVIKYFEYTHKFHDGHFPSTNNFYAIYFTLTGLHGLHVIGVFMHLISEKKVIYAVLILTAAFFLLVLLLPSFTIFESVAV